jgi:hypothetical protein
MSASAQRAECYGKMFPDFTRLKRKERLEGQAFTALVTGSGTGAQGRSLEVKREAWEKCVACPDYGTCYNLSLAKLEMNEALMNTMLADAWVGG